MSDTLVSLLQSTAPDVSPLTEMPEGVSSFELASSLVSSIVSNDSQALPDSVDRNTFSVAGETVKFFTSVGTSVKKNTRQTLVNTL